MSLNLDSLEAFTVFAETLNFTHAARELYISQPALHVKIKKLAQELGVPLYTKSGKRLELTEYGKQVARFARETRSSVDTFISDLTGRRVEQTVTLAAGRGSFLYLLGNAIARFRKKSDIRLCLLTGSSAETIEHVQMGRAQLGVTVLTTKPPGMKCTVIYQTPAKVVVPTNHPFATKRNVSVSSLKDSPLIVPPAGRPHRAMIDSILEMKNIPWQIAVEADGWELAMHFVQLGLGLAIVNGCCKLPRGTTGVPIRDFPGTKYYLLTRRNHRLTVDQEMLRELILESK